MRLFRGPRDVAHQLHRRCSSPATLTEETALTKEQSDRFHLHNHILRLAALKGSQPQRRLLGRGLCETVILSRPYGLGSVGTGKRPALAGQQKTNISEMLLTSYIGIEKDTMETQSAKNIVACSGEELQRRRIGPDGVAWRDVSVDDGEIDANTAWLAASEALRRVGGQPPNRGSLDKLIGEYGPARVWFHAVWFRPRLASMKKPPENPVGSFTASVREDYSINPKWSNLTFSRIQHGCFTAEQREAVPPSKSPAAWIRWFESFEGGIDDVPDDVRAEVRAELNAAAFGLVRNDLTSAQTGNNDLDDEWPF